MIIAIDGPAGSGKSTVARLLATRLGFHYLDTGAMYRAVAWRALEQDIPLTAETALAHLAAEEPITFEHAFGEALPSRVLIGGRDVTAQIRTPEADDAVSLVARLPHVRAAMVAQQRTIGEADDIVVEGRDIGTVVFPDADVKVFLTASAEERARRRAAEQAAKGHDVSEFAVAESMARRDALDSERDVSPLQPADDAVRLDTTGLTIDDVVERIAVLAKERR